MAIAAIAKMPMLTLIRECFMVNSMYGVVEV
jgi:hypothetical protein